MKINDICMSVLKLTDDDFKEVENAILEQKSYNHPLKMPLPDGSMTLPSITKKSLI